MLTLFAIPKAFRGHVNTIQRNAILSWTLLRPQVEVILLGDDAGTAEVAQEFNLKHIPQIERNEYGTPLMSSLFTVAQRVGRGPLFAYVNADIVLMNDFIQVVQQIPFERFMLTGQRWNLDITEPIAFDSDWQSQLRDRIVQAGKLEGPQAMDYFVFTQNTYIEIPPFAIGRLCWDNWMLYKALSLNIPLIDATLSITAVHQNHDYNHHPQGKQGVFSGQEAEHNLELLGGPHYTYFMLDLATWQMIDRGLQRTPWNWERLDRQLDMLPLAHPHLKPTFGALLHLSRRWNQLIAATSKFKGIPVRIFSRLKRSNPSSLR